MFTLMWPDGPTVGRAEDVIAAWRRAVAREHDEREYHNGR